MPEARLSEAEAYIMQLFWQHGAMKTEELSGLVAEKNWKPTTLLTFLSRLVGKGMLEAQKQGRANTYRPLVGLDEYRQGESRALLDELYGGSARDFIACLADGEGLSAGDLAELRAWLDEQSADT